MSSRTGSVTRILLATVSEDEVRALGGELRRAGMAVTRVRDVCGAADALAGGAFDVALLSHPFPDADVIGSCATLAQIAGAPPLVLLDDLDHGELEHTLPAGMRPASVLRKPVDAAKLVHLVRELLALPEQRPEAPAGHAGEAIAAALLAASRRGDAVAVELRCDGVLTRVFFAAGTLCGVEGGSLRETLGRILLRRGSLSEADYTRVIERMTENVIHDEHQRMGEVLVELGLLTGAEVYAALSEQVVEKVLACFQASACTVDFRELTAPPEDLGGFELPPVEALVLRGVREHVADAVTEAALRPLASRPLALALRPGEVAARFRLDAADQHVVARLHAKARVQDLLRESPAAAPLLTALVWCGAAGPASAAPAATPKAQAQFAREVVAPRRAAPAKNAAVHGAKPEPASADPKARLEAEQHFRRAQELVRLEKFAEAAKALERAVELQPLEPEYRMWEAWTGYLQARVEVRVARARAAACARRVLEAEPKAGKPHAFLGRIALDEGDAERATKELQAALLLDPEDPDAKKGLAQVRGKPSA